MEIERKFVPLRLPEHLERYPHRSIEQAYLNISPVLRVRRQDDEYILTYKGAGMMAREEYNLPLNRDSYLHLRAKADGNIITKKRYLVPLDGNLTAEIDIFEGKFEGLCLAEVEFASSGQAGDFQPPEWFGREVTYDRRYHNSYLSRVR